MLTRWLCRFLICAICTGAGAVGAQTITVSAAISLREAMSALGAMFSAAHPGIEVGFNFGSSGAMLEQIARGAPVDVYASADLTTMNRAASRRLIDPATRTEVAGNQLVLIVPSTRNGALGTLRDLQAVDLRRIAVGSVADVPAGRYARTALEAQRLWRVLTPKFAYLPDVREVLGAVSRGEVDAGFVYRTDAMLAEDTVRIELPVPLAQPVLYPIARVTASAHPAAAERFIAFCRSAPAQAVLARYGFTPP
jgi:molybdate transport system substrate-binding protein